MLTLLACIFSFFKTYGVFFYERAGIHQALIDINNWLYWFTGYFHLRELYRISGGDLWACFNRDPHVRAVHQDRQAYFRRVVAVLGKCFSRCADDFLCGLIEAFDRVVCFEFYFCCAHVATSVAFAMAARALTICSAFSISPSSSCSDRELTIAFNASSNSGAAAIRRASASGFSVSMPSWGNSPSRMPPPVSGSDT